MPIILDVESEDALPEASLVHTVGKADFKTARLVGEESLQGTEKEPAALITQYGLIQLNSLKGGAKFQGVRTYSCRTRRRRPDTEFQKYS